MDSSGIIASDAGGATTLNLAGGTLKASAAFSASVAATLTNTTIFDTNGFNVSYAGTSFPGAGALTKAGRAWSRLRTLTGADNYGGGTSVNAGTLLVTGTIGTGAVTIAPSATLNDQAINTNDTGLGSLRQAMLNANAASGAGANLITFNITGSGVHVISPHTALPTLSSAVLLDGTSQPGYSGTPLIELDGVSAGTGVNGLNLAASTITVQGLEINQFLGDGIALTVGGDTVRGNLIGTNAAGAANLGNSGNGVRLASGASDNSIGGIGVGAGNVIAFNTLAGVSVTGATSNGNSIRCNSIYANGGLTALADKNGGGNNNQAFPAVIAAAVDSSNSQLDPFAGTTQIKADFTGAPNITYQLDFYDNGATSNPSGFGQGKIYLGTTTITTDASGDPTPGSSTFFSVLHATGPVGDVLSITATDVFGNTSQFSNDINTILRPQFTLTGLSTSVRGQLAPYTLMPTATSTDLAEGLTYAVAQGRRQSKDQPTPCSWRASWGKTSLRCRNRRIRRTRCRWRSRTSMASRV